MYSSEDGSALANRRILMYIGVVEGQDPSIGDGSLMSHILPRQKICMETFLQFKFGIRMLWVTISLSVKQG